MEKVIRQTELATISLVKSVHGISVKVLLFDGRIFQGSFAKATPQMKFPATHSHYVADAKSNLPITIEVSEIILAEIEKIQAECPPTPIRRTYTDEWTGEARLLDDEVEAVEETEEVKMIRNEISELRSAIELHDEKEEVREADLARRQVVQLQNTIREIKSVKSR